MYFASNRELSLVIILFTLLVIILCTESPLRKALLYFFRAIFRPKLILLGFGILCSVRFFLHLFEPNIGWTNRQLFISLIWAITIGWGISTRIINQANKRVEASWSVVPKEISNSFSVTFLLSLISNYQSFSLSVEMIIFFGYFCFQILAVKTIKRAIKNDQNKIVTLVTQINTGILVFSGAFFLTASIMSMLREPENLVVIDFILPCMLTAFFVVFSSILYLYTLYSLAFMSIELHINDEKIKSYAKSWRVIALLNVNVKAIKRWSRIIGFEHLKPRTKADVNCLIKRARKSNEDISF